MVVFQVCDGNRLRCCQVMDQEGENDHLMKAVMRALNSAQEKVLPITQVCFSILTLDGAGGGGGSRFTYR